MTANERSGYDRRAAILAQDAYCMARGLPRFAPSDGVCWYCGDQIYTPSRRGGGITVEEAGSRIITGCPHCHKTFCD